jgi:flagellar protein FlgJ
MNVNPLQRRIDAAEIAPERLAGNPRLTPAQKIAEASRQFEAVLLRQILGDAQKTVIPSALSDNSTAAGIYQDLITNTLADNISKSGALGLAKVFEQQLTPPATGKTAKTNEIHSTTTAAANPPLSAQRP